MRGLAEQLGHELRTRHLGGCDDPRCEGCGIGLPLPRTCSTCARGNLAIHSFCGFCGTRLPESAPDTTTTVGFYPSEEITLLSGGAAPVHSDQITVISDNPGTDPHAHPPAELLETHSEPPTKVNLQTTTGYTQPLPVGDSLRGTGLCVLLLETDQSTEPNQLYPLEYGEPLDVDGPELTHPGTFTATPEGLRLDSLGGLRGVYLRLDPRSPRTPWRRLRTERDLGTFQALAPGESIPPGAMAYIDDILIRVDPL